MLSTDASKRSTRGTEVDIVDGMPRTKRKRSPSVDSSKETSELQLVHEKDGWETIEENGVTIHRRRLWKRIQNAGFTNINGMSTAGEMIEAIVCLIKNSRADLAKEKVELAKSE